MKSFKISSLVITLIIVCGTAFAQTSDPANPGGAVFDAVTEKWKPSLRRDGVIDRVPHNNYLNPWQPIREADVLWRKRVWREIDARQKQNYAFRYAGDEYSGGGMYIEIVMNAVKNGSVTAFQDERFTTALTYDDVQTLLVGTPDTIYVELENGDYEMRIIPKKFNPDDVTKFRMKEDWIFDRNLGRMVCRIVGISPYKDKYFDGEYLTSFPIFWVNYEELRPTNVRYEVYNPENDAFRMTWDDFFEKRMFSSYIVKSTINNPLEDEIGAYKRDIYRLYESEAVKEKIFNKEHDLWVY